MKILLLDAHREEGRRIQQTLALADFHCIFHRIDARETFPKVLANFQPQAILSDYQLANFTALDALALTRQKNSEVPFIIVAESLDVPTAVACLQAGADDVVLKSQLERLPEAIRQAAQKRLALHEKQIAEQALRGSEEQYRLIAENSRDLISLLDSNFHFLYASPSYKATLGHDPAQLADTPCLSLIHPDDIETLKDTLDEALFFREGRNAEIRLRHSNGSWCMFECTASFIFDAEGRPQRALLISHDTTDRKRAEREIRKLAAFPRLNPNPVLEFTADGNLSYFNDAALAMARTLKKNHPQAIVPLNTATIVKLCLSSGQSKTHIETSLGGRNLSWSFFPVVANQVVHCYAEDITERINLETQLRQMQKMESVGQLAAGVAHDFNNILTIIQGHAGLMQYDSGLPNSYRESSRQIAAAAERAANLTRQLLMFSRKQIMQPQLLNLHDIVTNVSKMLRSVLGETVTLRRNPPADLPTIHADPGMIEQVLVNLAVNARDAMPKGGAFTIHTYPIEIDESYVQRQPEARTGFFVCLQVSDTGHGMDPATLARIFEPFFTTKEIGKGTGLGLSTVYGIVKQHQGWIEVASQVGVGTTFRIYLPASSKGQTFTDNTTPKDIPGGSETILVVEDEPALRELVQEILKKKGYQVLGAASGAQALDIWKEYRHRIDLVLTDMMMPEGVSGRELAEHVLSERPELKVIYTSGYSLEVVSPDYTLKDGLNFLQKPYQPEVLTRMVRECLDR